MSRTILKGLLAFIFTVGIASQTFTQTWVNFNSPTPAEPIFNLVSSSESGVTFDVITPGMYRQTVVVNGTNYDRIGVPDNSAMRDVGMPEMPTLYMKVCVPACSGVNASYTVLSNTIFGGYHVYPAPDSELVSGTGGDYWDEVFTLSSNYTSGSPFPSAVVEVGDMLDYGDQHFIQLAVHPILTITATGVIWAYDTLRVCLTFNGVTGSIYADLYEL